VPDPAVRVRFSPAPTGWLHVGSARAALFNWMYARQQGGQFLLRIEDTDAERLRPELIDTIYDTLSWLGIGWDGDPVFQSARTSLYVAAADRLFAEGKAYGCDCAPDDVKARHDAAGRKTPGYDGFCRDRGLVPGPGVAMRFRTPDEGSTSFADVIRGEVTFENATLEDFVIVRGSGQPLFLLANAVDDVDMAITHVIRGEDLINTTPKVLLLREAMGVVDRPVYAHLPLLVGANRKKLSKRRDAVALADFVDQGYLPEAMVNYLVTLGWGPPDGIEIRPIDEIINLFRLEDVNSSGAFFDIEKLDSFNGVYIRALETDEFVERSQPWLLGQTGRKLPWDPADYDPAAFAVLAPLVQERVNHLDEVPGYVDFVFAREPVIDPASWDRVMVKGADGAAVMLDAIVESYETCEWDAAVLMALIQAEGERLELPKKQWQAPVRVAVTGRTIGPPLGESMVVLGRDRTLARLRAARSRL
jgi:glutamyl-tRNA synthetase